MKSHEEPIARRTLLMAALASSVAPQFAQANVTYPIGPVKIVSPSPPGSVNDALIRIVAEQLTKKWQQPVIIDNKPGAASMIGTASVANSKPDGHTLLLNISLMIQNPILRSKLPYDPKSISPVMQLNRQQLPIFSPTSAKINNIGDLISLARKNPGKVNFATWGEGSTAHIILRKMELDHNIKFNHIPYKGAADIVQAAVSGQVDVASSDFLSPKPFIANGKLQLLAVTGPQRLSSFPKIPTLLESGVSGFEGYNWIALFAPRATPSSVVEKIYTDVNEILMRPEIKRRMEEDFFVEPITAGPAAFGKIYQSDSDRWARAITATNIKLD